MDADLEEFFAEQDALAGLFEWLDGMTLPSISRHTSLTDMSGWICEALECGGGIDADGGTLLCKTVTLDASTVTMLTAHGDGELSEGIRRAARLIVQRVFKGHK